jgi:hypothetical protein
MIRSLLVGLAVLGLAGFTAGCGGKDGGGSDKKDGGSAEKKGDAAKAGTASAPGGAESPEKLFEGFKKVAGGPDEQMSPMLPFVVPEERPVLAFYMNFAAGMLVAFGGDGKPDMKKAYEDLRAKYKLPEKVEGDEGNIEEIMKDYAKLVALSGKAFKGVDVAAYLKDIEAFMDKYGDKSDKSEKPAKAEKVVTLKDVKIEGDAATGVMAEEGKPDKPCKFKKVDGRWYISLEGIN